MIQIDDTLVSDDVLLEDFACDLSRCRGACCIEGDAGAPITDEEKAILEQIFPQVQAYMRPEGVRAVRQQGPWAYDPYDHAPSTPLVGGRECAYVYYDAQGFALCAIEQAFAQGRIAFKKPISCHMYPIRLTRILSMTALNYHRWDICRCACERGKKQGIPVYEFLREPLVRRFGADWYEQLRLTAREYRRHLAEKNGQPCKE